jgi:hypothetical protein
MPRLKSIAREILGLFVDDGSFAIAILLFLAFACVGGHFALHSGASGPLLFIGLAIILIESVLRFARRRPPS